MTDFNLSERIEENDEDTMEEFELSQNEYILAIYERCQRVHKIIE